MEIPPPVRFLTALITIVPAMILATPSVLALDDGLIETSSNTPSDDGTRAEVVRTITNASDGPIDVEPRDLRMDDYATLTVVEISTGSFTGGIWAVGHLEPGETAEIKVEASDPVAPPSDAQGEELPSTGPGYAVVMVAAIGLAALVAGLGLRRAGRD